MTNLPNHIYLLAIVPSYLIKTEGLSVANFQGNNLAQWKIDTLYCGEE